MAQVYVAALLQVQQTTGSGNQQFHSAPQLVDLGRVAHAAVDCGHALSGAAGAVPGHVFYLAGQCRTRLFHYGGSQGGHISLLSAIFAPQTFAFVYAACPLTHLDQRFRTNAGRNFSDCELSARDAHEHAERIQCPVFIEHGTADVLVDWEKHTQAFVAKLEALGKPVFCEIFPGGDHSLLPVSSRAESFRQRAPEPINAVQNSNSDDFAEGRVIRIPCGSQDLVIDWREPTQSMDLIKFVETEK